MIYINTENGSHKFWGYSSEKEKVNYMSNKWTVTTYWGRIGQSLDNCQRKSFTFEHEFQARDFIEKKLREKQGKGYRPVEGIYEDMIEGKDYASSTQDKAEIADVRDIDIY